MARIEITNEREAGAGWAFDVLIADAAIADAPRAPATDARTAATAAPPGGGTGHPDGASGHPDRATNGTSTRHEVRLSWADYEYWSHGLAAPAAIVEMVLAFMLAQHDAGLELRPSLDLARVRHRWPRVDDWVAGRI